MVVVYRLDDHLQKGEELFRTPARSASTAVPPAPRMVNEPTVGERNRQLMGEIDGKNRCPGAFFQECGIGGCDGEGAMWVALGNTDGNFEHSSPLFYKGTVITDMELRKPAEYVAVIRIDDNLKPIEELYRTP
ncbi:hypothetical protein EV193_106125 [Herbihabitans rhizosphaerae]|uniref:Uncharacterized protein n=1 Tax=Herbihabitans rhizosphaerae TaxID=1872711 RepID=A0A4Q7KMR6_9PSEU|nr:hypothetical protein [Herbihabitans rhizosphaerae]RZS36891.1 hypothetical protein EV193_106125 [Herbihabitans rhizosphaerae]